jgi:hypothetical protein
MSPGLVPPRFSIFEGRLKERPYPIPADCLLTGPVQAALGKRRAALLPIFPLSLASALAWHQRLATRTGVVIDGSSLLGGDAEGI